MNTRDGFIRWAYTGGMVGAGPATVARLGKGRMGH